MTTYCWKFWKFCSSLNRTRLHKIRWLCARNNYMKVSTTKFGRLLVSSCRIRNSQFIKFSFLFMLKKPTESWHKGVKICQAIKNLASDKRSLHASLKLFRNLEDSGKCRCRFKLFVDLLDSLKQGTTGKLHICDTYWLLQTVPGFADFAGVVEITRLNTSEFLYLSGWTVR